MTSPTTSPTTSQNHGQSAHKRLCEINCAEWRQSMEEVHDRVMVEPAREIFCHLGRWGTETSGQWSSGSYRVEICVDDQATIDSNFAIAADQAAQLHNIKLHNIKLHNIKRLLHLTGLQPG